MHIWKQSKEGKRLQIFLGYLGWGALQEIQKALTDLNSWTPSQVSPQVGIQNT